MFSEMALKQKIVPALIVSMLVFLAVLSITTLNPYVIVAASSITLVSLFAYKLWYVIEAYVFQHSNIIELVCGYELKHDRSAAIRYYNGRFSAVAAAHLEVGTEVQLDGKKIENIIQHTAYPFKFSLQVERMELAPLLNKMQTKRSMLEIELSRIDVKKQKNIPHTEMIRRRIEQIDSDIMRISSGDVPVKASFYVMSSASSQNEYDAEEKAKSQIRELSSHFDALLGSRSKKMEGEELLSLLQFDSSMVFS
jgi:hypothetical protein